MMHISIAAIMVSAVGGGLGVLREVSEAAAHQGPDYLGIAAVITATAGALIGLLGLLLKFLRPDKPEPPRVIFIEARHDDDPSLTSGIDREVRFVREQKP